MAIDQSSTVSTPNIGPLQTVDQDLRSQQITLPDPRNMFKRPSILCCYGRSFPAGTHGTAMRAHKHETQATIAETHGNASKSGRAGGQLQPITYATSAAHICL